MTNNTTKNIENDNIDEKNIIWDGEIIWLY